MEKKDIILDLKSILKPGRYEHTQGVRYTAASLAMAHACDMEKAQLAGLLHDCAKCYSDEKLMEMCREHGIQVTEAEIKAPQLLHAKVGAVLARNKYGVEDEDIIDAICYHTTGKPNMTDLAKIIFIADFIEPNRRMLACLPECRKYAFEDLDKAMYYILKNTLDYLRSQSEEIIDKTTQAAYVYYEKLVLERR